MTSLWKDHAAPESSRLPGKCQSAWEWGNGIRAAVENPGWIIKAPCSGTARDGAQWNFSLEVLTLLQKDGGKDENQ